MNKMKILDCLFLIANSSSKTYQKLSISYSAIEPPTWALLLAQSTRSVGFEVRILDANAERINEEQILSRLKDLDPKIAKYRDFEAYFLGFYDYCFELPLDNMIREAVNFNKRYGCT